MLTATNLLGLLEELRLESYSEFLEKARLLGRSVKKDWDAHRTQLKDPSIKKDKFTSNPEFKEFLIEKIARILFIPADEKSDENKVLKTGLSDLRDFLTVWDDGGLSRESESNLRLRQSLKYKESVCKDDRHAIKITLLILVFILSEQADDLFHSKKEEYDQIKNIRVTSFKEINTTRALIDFLPKHIIERERPSKQEIEKKIDKIAHAISSFVTPTKKKKALKYLGIFIAWIASLAAGISTGGAVYLLFPTLVIPAIITGVFIFAVGYIANFRFFSQNLPNFLLSLVKKGGATEFINQQGRREQLSRLKKYLLLPLALLASLTVGISGAALTYTAILSLVSSVFPILAILWPPLPLVIVGILALSVLVVLTVSTFNAIIEMLKTPLPSLKDLRKIFSIENIRTLNARQILSCVMQTLLIPVALFGLVYFRITAGVDLSTLTGLVGALITGVAAFIAQIAFTILSINKLNNVLIPPCPSSPTQTENLAATPHKSWFSRIKSSLAWIGAPICLVSNAVGNAALVYTGSPLSTAGAVACGLNSLAGNIPEQDINQIKRTEANRAIVKEVISCFTKEGLQKEIKPENIPQVTDKDSNPPLGNPTKKGDPTDKLTFSNGFFLVSNCNNKPDAEHKEAIRYLP